MFEEIFFPRTAERYRAAPLAEQRSRYLLHLKDTGSCRSILRKCANHQLSLVRLLDLQDGDRVNIRQIEAATARWSQPRGRRCVHAASPKVRRRFIGSGVRWLRFLGWLDEPKIELPPHHAELKAYEDWQRQVRGLSDATIESYCRAADRFFIWLAGKNIPLINIRIVDIDKAIAAEHRSLEQTNDT